MPRKTVTQNTTQKEFKAFERLFNKIRSAKASSRREGQRTLTPALMRKHLASGAPLSLIYGVNADGTPFTTDDLKRFDKRAQAVRGKYKMTGQGVPAYQLIAASRAVDIERSKKEIRNATFYRIFNSKSGVVLHFRVSASQQSKFQHHQVRVRLEEWTDWLTSTKSFNKAAKKTLNGRISFDCDCGRHQFWYRYVATIGGFALRPLENAYPKIRNPRLTGACCKHVLKALATLRTPVVQRIVSDEMKKTADKIGFGDDNSVATRFLKGKELKKATRAGSAARSVSQKEAREAFKIYQGAKKGIRKKMSEKKSVDALEKLKLEKAVYKQIAKKAQREKDALSQNLLREKLNSSLLMAVYRDKIPKEQAMKAFAKEHQLPMKEVEGLAEGINI